MAYLLDTSIFGRLANPSDKDYAVAEAAVKRLHVGGEVVHSCPQNYTEFRAIATQPKPPQANGLGLSIAETERLAAGFELAFPLLPDNPDIHPEWKRLVAATATIGKPVHDARLAAVCSVHRITQLLTFNVAHFTRFVPHIPGFVVVHPQNV